MFGFMKIRFSSSESIRKKTNKYNRKKRKRNAVKTIKSLKKMINKKVSAGKYQAYSSIDESDSYYDTKMLACRWLRRYTDYDVKIDSCTECSLPGFSINITWF